VNPRRRRKWYIMEFNYIPKYQREIKGCQARVDLEN
jgi:hypothetical protein